MTLRRYHAPVWDEPIIMEMGAPGRRGQHFPRVEAKYAAGGLGKLFGVKSKVGA